MTMPLLGADAAIANGVKMTRVTYGNINDSLRLIIEIMREAKDDPRLRGWAGRVYRAAGSPTGSRQHIQAILDEFRKKASYVADPVGTEFIAKPWVVLCLEDSVCVPIFDCDEGLATVGSALMSMGFPVMIVVQTWNDGRQPHVLLVVYDEDSGDWVYVDPGGNAFAANPISGLKVGESPKADHEVRYDPMDAHPDLNLPAADPKLVGVGMVRVGSGAVSGWDPITTPTFTLNPGDVLRGSFIFDDIDSALYPGPMPIDYLRYVLRSVFANSDSYAVWDENDTLPADWPTSDVPVPHWPLPTTNGNRTRFRVWYGGATPIQLTPPTAGSMRLWLSHGNPPAAPTVANPPNAPVTVYNPVTNKTTPSPPLNTDSGVTVFEAFAWGTGVLAIGGLAYMIYRSRRGRR